MHEPAIAGVAPNDLWAIGSAGSQTLALHWDGTRWSVVTTPNGPHPWNQLSGVAAVSSTDVWAVGLSQSEVDTCGEGCYEYLPDTLVERWDGTHWSVVASPSPVAGQSSLVGVAASSNGPAWAVGMAGGQTLIEQNSAP